VRINIGCGRRPLAGWLNVDLQRYDGVDYSGTEVILADVREPATWQRWRGVEEIRADQFLEHLTIPEGRQFLARCRTALISGGRLRLTVPDFAAHVADYLERKQRVPLSSPSIAEGLFRPEINVLIRMLYDWGHRTIYDAETLGVVLDLAGFRVLEMTHPDGANVVVTATPRLPALAG
jgi:predicted SAM-dependent methyltransferase